jgi:hypothetical protein
MAVKTIEMVRTIRDRHYETIKGLALEEQLKFIKEKSSRLHKELKETRRSTADNKRTSA